MKLHIALRNLIGCSNTCTNCTTTQHVLTLRLGLHQRYSEQRHTHVAQYSLSNIVNSQIYTELKLIWVCVNNLNWVEWVH